MSEIIEDQPPDRHLHVILDNYCTHKKNETWLAAHPNVTFHFTPQCHVPLHANLGELA